MSFPSEYTRPAVTVDCVVFGYAVGKQLKVLLIERLNDPFAGRWALPGGFVEENEPLETAALRELEEETGVQNIFVEQLYTFGSPNRDPRGRVITIAYYALVNLEKHPVHAGTDAKHARWFPVDELPLLAFDHQLILEAALNRLRTKIRYQPIGFELLPEEFTLTQLQELYEAILGVRQALNKRNFRSRILKMGVLKEVGIQEHVAHRPARLYRFDSEVYHEMQESKSKELIRRGIDFEI